VKFKSVEKCANFNGGKQKKQKTPKKKQKKTLARDLFPIAFKISCLGSIAPWQGKFFLRKQHS